MLPSAPPCPPRGPLQLPQRLAASKLPPRSKKVSGRTLSGTCSPTTRLARLRQFPRKRGPHGCRCPRRTSCRRPSAWRAQRRPSPRPWEAMGEGRRVRSCSPSPSGQHQQRSTVIAALAGLTGLHAGRAAVAAKGKAAAALPRPAARQAVPREGGPAGPPSVFGLRPVEGASMSRPLLQRLAADGPPPSRGHLGAAGAQRRRPAPRGGGGPNSPTAAGAPPRQLLRTRRRSTAAGPEAAADGSLGGPGGGGKPSGPAPPTAGVAGASVGTGLHPGSPPVRADRQPVPPLQLLKVESPANHWDQFNSPTEDEEVVEDRKRQYWPASKCASPEEPLPEADYGP